MNHLLAVVAVLFFGASASAQVPSGDTSQTALDWAGHYEGTLPCADCVGIETVLELRDDGSYALHETYIDRGGPFVHEGHFVWAADGGSITLDAAGDGRRYKVGEGRIWHLDKAGQMIEGALAPSYILTKRE